MQTRNFEGLFCSSHSSYMLKFIRRKLRRLCFRIRHLLWRRRRPRVVIKRFGKTNSKQQLKRESGSNSSIHPDGKLNHPVMERPLCVATFNVAMFSLAPAIPRPEDTAISCHEEEDFMIDLNPMSSNYHPRSILKQSPLHNSATNTSHLPVVPKSKQKVSINLPDNEITLSHTKMFSHGEKEKEPDTGFGGFHRNTVPVRSPVCFPIKMTGSCGSEEISESNRSILEVLREVDADILALQDVKAVEEKEMRPLSDLAAALGMKYVFAESWAPEYGNAILSKWTIKRWNVQKIADDEDFRNVLKATIDVPGSGEVNFYCTQLDHLDEAWRMKQISATVQSSVSPHILAGGLNSLSGSDYSLERWTDIVKYYEKIGKPTPKLEVMKFLKGKGYTDAKDFAGECEPVVIIAKGQNVQGTCKYGTRVDYIMASRDAPFEFVPRSYSVISSKGTSDHHIVKVDLMKSCRGGQGDFLRGLHKQRSEVVKIMSSCSSRGVWKTST